MPRETELGVFAKYWQPGKVKTRLAAAVGSYRASEIYRHFVDTTTTRFRDMADLRTLVYWPASRRAEFAALPSIDRWRLDCQVDGDLGQRMRHFFSARMSAGRDVVLIGSDSPSLPHAMVGQAFRELRQRDVVLGPSCDGGYYLIGICGSVPPIFEDLAWSTPYLLQQTIDRLDRAGVGYAMLPDWYDVDTVRDLRRLHLELLGRVSAEPSLRQLADSVSQVVS